MSMIESIQNFKNKGLYDASIDFFASLNIPIDHITSKSIDIADMFKEPHSIFQSVKDVYAIGMLNDSYFKGNQSSLDINVKKDYQGILLFSIELSTDNPTRKTLADISRAFNREYHYTPVIILFKYNNKLSLANTQRQKYKIDKEGEKTGKVIILRDVNIDSPHRGHIDILESMKIDSKVNSFELLYQHWQNVFDISLLNKKFYQELSHWFFYAVREVTFPGQPDNIDDATEHKSKNVIRLLTRFLFVWFIKEKGLIPSQLFDEGYLKELLNDFNPKNMDNTLFGGHDKTSLYYKAILQNLFFASLNCPIKPLDDHDTRSRGFRKKDHRGQNRDANFLMRYEDSFNNPQEYLLLINQYVPFLNGGLFECLDDKTNGIYIDGFSDNLPNPHKLIVPDYLFFGIEDHVDLSVEYGIKNKAFKDATVKGLIKILDSYKFTVTENTPIEEDVALDPELLGRVFENLLASYNPETKTTARKQTGSFYTPREIVNYMVEEGLISYLKSQIKEKYSQNDLESKLRELCSYSDNQPFSDTNTIAEIIDALNNIKSLDPAVGSGAFPMGMLQKMVHILSKLDPNNEYWKKIQKEKAQMESSEVFESNDKENRTKLLDEINNIFDERVNNPDYARKLYIIENSIYGVDIQSIAIQISKLRFFISLVIEQKIDKNKDNFGIKPLPNLETKFIAANTLLGIEKDASNLFNNSQIKELEQKLQDIRHRLFNAKTPQTKRKLRTQDRVLREQIAEKLIENGLGNESAKLLAHWDPYEQSKSSSFFDKEWMFGLKKGFDIVLGNPPYIDSETMVKNTPELRENLKKEFKTAKGNWDIFVVFIEKSLSLTKENGCLTLIVPNKLVSAKYTQKIRELMNKHQIGEIIDYSNVKVFSEADVYPIVFRLINNANQDTVKTKVMDGLSSIKTENYIDRDIFYQDIFWDKYFFDKDIVNVILKISEFKKLSHYNFQILGAATVNEAYQVKEALTELADNHNEFLKFINTGTIDPFESLWGIKNTQYIKHAYVHPIIKIEHLKEINYTRYLQSISPKIIIAGMAIKVEAFYDYGDYLAGKSTTIILGNEDYLSVLTAILNSSLVTFWFSKYYNSLSMSGGYFNMGRNEISSIPIPDLETINIDIFKKFVDFIIFLKEQIYKDPGYNIILADFEKILNGMIFELYFENEMKENKINIIEYVTKNIKETKQYNKLNELNESSQIDLIKTLHSIWTHPDNELRNRIKLFAVRSPHTLKPILENK